MTVSFRDKRGWEFAEGIRIEVLSSFKRKEGMKLNRLEVATSLLD
jgi:hypothetical protein